MTKIIIGEMGRMSPNALIFTKTTLTPKEVERAIKIAEKKAANERKM